jgi:acetate kinase
MAGPLILIANPGSASRKYALYEGERERAQLHFEWYQDKIICTIHQRGEQHLTHTVLYDMGAVPGHVVALLQEYNALGADERIARVGLRIVAPSSYFLEDHIIDDGFVDTLQATKRRAPIHIAATLEELAMLRKEFSDVPIMGVSDSAFHATKPDYAWNYGIALDVADHFEIKRFGYHGLSVGGVVHELNAGKRLAPKLIVCHLGSGASVSAVHGGKSIDNTMGFSPLEGVVMSTRSGSIDPTAVRALKDVCGFDDNAVEDYLNNRSGLQGLGGSSDIRELLRREEDGDNRSRLALTTYIYSVQKAIGQMASALGGADMLVFTGTVGERSAVVRERVAARLHYLDFIIDAETNNACEQPEQLTVVSRLAHSKPVYVIPTAESAEIVRHVLAAL